MRTLQLFRGVKFADLLCLFFGYIRPAPFSIPSRHVEDNLDSSSSSSSSSFAFVRSLYYVLSDRGFQILSAPFCVKTLHFGGCGRGFEYGLGFEVS